MMQQYNPVFAPFDHDLTMERIAGGNETEVYRTDDGQYVVKLKADLSGSIPEAIGYVRILRAAADAFSACLGPYSLPSAYVIARDGEQQAQVIVLQPYLQHAIPLHDLDYGSLSSTERQAIAEQLRDIIQRSLRHYRSTGSMPDLYGRSSKNSQERQQNNSLAMLPSRVWSFLVRRNLLRSHNLLLVRGTTPRIVLVDYDPVRRSQLYRQIYYLVRWLLFWRDHALILSMRRGAPVPGETSRRAVSPGTAKGNVSRS